ncbi:hypothetical protein BDV28DRAFT_7151 [Aspergillus coremiiformis]|uniref:Polyketide synthase n=1 Tax=Aspergillus coremiiformis TaxID=138285 RepID=A0A5N6ZEZ8_9EURO|nr:hypothetical protein BDV28DRAFT_7151 [Aspergillus coremiiformis]
MPGRTVIPDDPSAVPEPIAVIGMGCRFSGEASSVEGFWNMLSLGRTGHGRVPSTRYEASAWHHPSHERKGAINHDSGFFINQDPARFDAPFFAITAKEAAGMDPVQRLLLEVAYEAFENGGVPMETLPGSPVGVYSGCMTNDYELLSTRDIYDMPHNSATGNGRTMLANRLSWFFDLRGPSIMMDTACSSSLTALHLATQALRAGECNMALVTGASLILHPNFTQRLSYMHMLSADGISHSFDSKANGYGRGEGIGAVLLKPLSKALSDGDVIRAVVRSTGSNQDGRTPGITVPNAGAQADLIRATYRHAQLSMRDTAYFEAHGTGTEIGDPTELAAIGQSFGAERTANDEPVYVGSVKSNVGHTEGAAGVASLIKVILCLEKGMLVPNAGFSQLNPKIRLDEWGLRLSNTAMPWPLHLPQRASINSFGFGGSNAHAIIESAAQYLGPSDLPAISSAGRIPQIVVFSTHDKAGIDRTAEKWKIYLESQIAKQNNIPLSDIAFTLHSRRSQLAFRSFAVVDSMEQLRDTMAEGLPSFPRANRKNQTNLVFVCTGQGAQWAQMGVELLANPVFAQSVARSQQILQSLGCSWDLGEEMHATGPNSRMNQPDRSQPICCVLQIALVDMLASWGVHPKAVVGHSSGEVGAAYAAGYLTQEDAIRVTYFRGVFSQQIAQSGRQGGMLAAGISAADGQVYLKALPPNSVVIACVNSPASVTFSGDADQIAQLEKSLQADGHFARRLRVDTAYHSPHMQDLAKDYGEAIQSIKPENRHGGSIPMFSSVTKQRVHPDDLGAAYWVRNMVSPVEFEAAVTAVATMTETGKGRRRAVPVKWGAFLEIGPHDALKGPFTQTLKEVNDSLLSVPYKAPVLRKQNALQTALHVAGTLWSTGYAIDLDVVNGSLLHGTQPQMTRDLPSYAWNHQSAFWHEPLESARLRQRKEPRHDLLGVSLDYQNDLEPRWRNFLRVSELPWIADHVVAGSIIFPAAGMVGMVAEAARQLADPTQPLKGIEFHDLQFLRGVVIPSDERGLETGLHVVPHRGVPGWYEFGLFSLPENSPWIQHAKGAFVLEYETAANVHSGDHWDRTVERVRQTQSAAVDAEIETVYDWLSQTGGVTLGPTFRSMAGVSFCSDPPRLHVSAVVPDTKQTMPYERESSCFIHPTSLDALFQAVVLSCSDALSNQNASIPVGVDRLYLPTNLSLQAGDQFSVHIETRWENGESRSEAIASDLSWQQPMVMLQGVRLGKVPMPSTAAAAGAESGQSHYSRFVWAEHIDSSSGSKAAPTHCHSLLQHWVERVCHTHGDATALVLAAHDRTTDVVEALQAVAPQQGQRPCLQELTFVLSGPTTDPASSPLGAVEQALPGCQGQLVASLDKLDASLLSEDPYDVVIVDDPDALNSDNMQSLLDMLLSVTRPDAWIALRALSADLDTTIDRIKQHAGWEARGTLDHDDFVLARRLTAPASLDPVIYALTTEPADLSHPLLHELGGIVADLGSQLTPVGLDRVADLEGKMVISLLELYRPWVANWTAAGIDEFRTLMRAKYVLWVSQHADEDDFVCAGSGATTGLLRTLRNENTDVTLPQIQFNSMDLKNSAGLARSIAQVIQLTLQPSSRPLDWEFYLKDGGLHVPRAIASEPVDEAMNTLLHGPRAVLGDLAHDSRPLRLQMDSKDLDQSEWGPDESLQATLPADQVEVQLQMVSVSPRDGKANVAPEARISGVEATGTVHRVGSTVGYPLAVGDQVVLAMAGDALADGIATRVRVPRKAIMKMPPHLTDIQSVSMPIAYAAAYTSLSHAGLISPVLSSSVLVVGSPSQTLQAIINCALAASLAVYVAVDGEDAADSLRSQYPNLTEHIMVIHRDLEHTISRLTGRQGVDISVCCLGGSVGRLAARCLAPGGRLVDLSEEINLAALPHSFMDRGCTFTAIRLSRMLRDTPDQIKTLFHRAVDLLTRHGGSSNVHPYTVFPVSRLTDAFSHARDTGTRVILDLQAPGKVPIVPPLPERVSLPATHTYLLVGGLGTLGLALAETLTDCGARHLVFVSRSGAMQEAQQAALARLQDRGVRCDVVRCDVAVADDLRRVAREQNWQIRGVLQCATVLQDAMFDKMTFAEWKKSTTPKIQGTHNLHRLLSSSPLDFFITLSSVASVIGNMGQANYSAGNSFMDALMVWRRRHNLPGHSINIGLVPDSSGVSDIAETPEQRRQRYSHLDGTEITTHELQTLLHLILQNPTAVPPQTNAGMRDSLPRNGAATWQFDRKFDHRIQFLSEHSSGSIPTSTLLKKTSSIDEALPLINHALQEYLASAMAASVDSIDLELPLFALGVDSLKAAEVRNWVSRELGAELSSFEFLGSQPVRILAEKIAAASCFVSA